MKSSAYARLDVEEEMVYERLCQRSLDILYAYIKGERYKGENND